MNLVILVECFLVLLIGNGILVLGFADWMTKDFCERSLGK